MRRLSQEDWVENAAKCNACHFTHTPWRRWLNTCGELHISEGGDRERGFWAEPAHSDGAASILHLGLCLAGRKFVKFEQPGGMPDVIVEIEPGGCILAVSLGRAIKSYTPRRRSTSWRGLGQRGDPAQSLS